MIGRRDLTTLPLTPERLREVAKYDALTGLMHPVGPARGTRYDQPLGCRRKSTGYRSIDIDRVTYQASWLAWLYVYGRWPIGILDHINGVRDDNRIENLREVTAKQNRANRRRGLYPSIPSPPKPTHCGCGKELIRTSKNSRRLFCAECVRLRGIQRVLDWQQRATTKELRRPSRTAVGGGRRRIPLTQENLKKCLHYDEHTGVLTWLVNRSQYAKAGDIAGYLFAGYVRVRFSGTTYLAHRLIWFYVSGRWPSHQIDHINLDKSDNRLCNLREATASQNAHNIRVHNRNQTGLKGVSKRRDCNRWVAQIAINGVKMYLGLFKTPKDAAAAYKAASDKYHGEFARAA